MPDQPREHEYPGQPEEPTPKVVKLSDEGLQVLSGTIPGSLADFLQQGWVEGREARAVGQQVQGTGLCASCRKQVGEFRDEVSRREYKILGMCQRCQDELYGAVAEEDEVDPEEARARKDLWYRCGTCGVWRLYEIVDVGVYDSQGKSPRYETCCYTPDGADPLPRVVCSKNDRCWISDGHQGPCDPERKDSW